MSHVVDISYGKSICAEARRLLDAGLAEPNDAIVQADNFGNSENRTALRPLEAISRYDVQGAGKRNGSLRYGGA